MSAPVVGSLKSSGDRRGWRPWILLLGALLLALFTLFSFFDVTIVNVDDVSPYLGKPWFRREHEPHMKIPIAKAARSIFGRHKLPKNDVFIAPYWTEREKRFLPCLDRRCVCGYFEGDNKTSGEQCLLSGGAPLQPAMRKEIRMLTEEERIAFETAVNTMKRDGTYNRLGRIHKYSGTHNGPGFTLWHREFLKRMEIVIRSYMPSPHRFGIPYWDSSLDADLPEPTDSIMFSPILLGTTDEHNHVVTGPYANWKTMEGFPYITRLMRGHPEGEFLSATVIDWIANQTDVQKVLAVTLPLSTCTEHLLDGRFLEYVHNYVHLLIAGDMTESWSSGNDIIFILHHSMVDLMFEMFRQNGQNRTARETEYPKSNPTCFPHWHNGDFVMPMLDPHTNKDALSNGYTDNMYEFAPRPTCDAERRDCGSKYLYCDTRNGGARCISKIRPGGNCEGFDGTSICYDGMCIRGRCIGYVLPFDESRIQKKSKKFVLNM